MSGERAMTSELRRRRASDDESSEQHDSQGVPEKNLSMISSYELRSTWPQYLDLKHLYRIDLSGCINILPNSFSEMTSKLKHLNYFELKSLLSPEVKRNDMLSKLRSINPEKFPPLPKRRDVEHDSSTSRRLLPDPRYTGVETMPETGCASGNPAETLLPPEVEGNDMSTESWRINLQESPAAALLERCDAEHGSLTQRFPRTPGYTGVETMSETGCASGNPAEKWRETTCQLSHGG